MTAVSINKHSSRSHLRLNQISRGAEFFFALILGRFALLCIIPFVFVVIISFTGESSISAQGYSFFPLSWSLDAYRQEAELTLKNQRLIALYCGDISVTDQEVQDYYEQQYVSVYRARYEDDIPLFEQEVLLSGGQTYYIPEGYRRIKHIVMALPDADAASAQIAAIYQALDAGESFESQMQRYSYDTSVPPEDAGYLLHADSQLWDEAEPVVTSAGVHIILYAADEPAGPLALTDEQHDLLTQAALTDKQTRRLEELVSQWREAYDIETHPEWLTFYDE